MPNLTEQWTAKNVRISVLVLDLLTKFLSQGVEDGSEAAAAASGPLPGGGGRPMWLSVFGNCEAALEIFVGVRGRTAAELHLHVLGIDVKSRLTERANFFFILSKTTVVKQFIRMFNKNLVDACKLQVVNKYSVFHPVIR